MPTVPASQGPRAQLDVGPGQTAAAPKFGVPDVQLQAPTLRTSMLSTPQLNAPKFTAPYKDPNAIRRVQLSDRGARQMEGVGEAFQNVGGALGKAVLDYRVKVNATIVDDALQQARTEAMRLTFGHKDEATGNIVGGYRNLNGYDAFKRPGDVGLDDEVGGEFDKRVKAIAKEKLTNADQRAAFEAQIGDVGAQLRQGAMAHQAQQFETYQTGVYKAALANETAAFGTISIGDREGQQKAMARIEGAVGTLAVQQGASDAEYQLGVRVARSEAVTALFDVAISEKNYSGAQALLNEWGKDGKLTSNAIVAMKGKVDAHMQIQIGEEVASDIWHDRAAPAFNVGTSDRAWNVVKTTEAHGAPRHVGDDGKLLVSPAGAYGVSQIMPDTAKRMAKKLGRPELYELSHQTSKEGQAANELLGRAAWDEVVQQFHGDLPKAYAAYNAGAGWLIGGKDSKGNKLEGALKIAARTGTDWREHLPKETQDYVRAAMSSFGSGEGVPPKPKLSDLLERIDAKITDPDARKAAYAWTTQRFNASLADEERGHDDAYAEGIRIVRDTGTINAVPPELRGRMKPGDYETLSAHAKSVAEGADRPTDNAAYFRLSDDTYLKGLTRAQLWAFMPQLSNDHFQKFADHWSDLQKPAAGAASKDPRNIDAAGITAVLNTRLQFLGIDPTPKKTEDVARVGAIRQFVRDAVYQRQQQLGRKLEDAEVDDTINKLFTRDQAFKKTWMGVTTGGGTERVMTRRLADLPENTRQRLQAQLQKAGIKEPSEAQMLDAYFRSTFYGG